MVSPTLNIVAENGRCKCREKGCVTLTEPGWLGSWADIQIVRAVAMAIACDIQPVQNLRVLKHHVAVTEGGVEAKMAWGKWAIETGFVHLEALLERTCEGGDFCCGGVLTMADCCLVPQVYNANRFHVDMSQFPNIARINAALLLLAVVDKSKPEAMSDAVL